MLTCEYNTFFIFLLKILNINKMNFKALIATVILFLYTTLYFVIVIHVNVTGTVLSCEKCIKKMHFIKK